MISGFLSFFKEGMYLGLDWESANTPQRQWNDFTTCSNFGVSQRSRFFPSRKNLDVLEQKQIAFVLRKYEEANDIKNWIARIGVNAECFPLPKFQ